MKTPIADFVKKYAKSETVRFHMPGHKGKSILGCEEFDITEIKGADALYEAEGIIAESEKNASELFETGKTLFSTEGSSQCIKAMLYLAMTEKDYKKRPYVLAARNVHKAFLYAAALLDFDVVWMYPDEMHSLCSCKIMPQQVEEELKKREERPFAVYLTSPDYLGEMADIEQIAKVCHKYNTILAVDNAHGAYLHFLKEKKHPIDLGADICADSAHKTLPVLTGGAYLQISKNAPSHFLEKAKEAMALFGSTSPSYLTLASLDMCNLYLESEIKDKLKNTLDTMEKICYILTKNGWEVYHTEPLKIVILCPHELNGYALSDLLREKKIECEYADDQYVVFMISAENDGNDLERLVQALSVNQYGKSQFKTFKPVKTIQAISVRKAVFSQNQCIEVEKAEGKICGQTTVSCPPAIPIVLSGEIITKEAIELFQYYKIKEVEIVK